MPVDMKSMIADTLNQLLCQKSLDKITVKELVEACHISRQTFYYHFQDIMEVIEWYQHKMLEQSIAASLAAPNGRDAIKGVVQEAFRHKALICQLMASQRRAQIEQLFLRTIRTYLEEMLRQKAPELPLSPADVETVLQFYSGGIVWLMLSSLEQKEPDVDALSRQIYRLLSGELTFRFAGQA